MLDELDREILKSIDGKESPAISEAIRPFLGEKSDRALRERLRHLEREGLVRLKKYPGCVVIKITRRGHAEAQSAEGGEPHV